MSEVSIAIPPASVKVSGVYIIINTQTKRFYVGSSNDLDHRWAKHFWSLEKGTHRNPDMQAEYTACGLAAFIHFTLETCPADQLVNREQWWMQQLRTAGAGCYNVRRSSKELTQPSGDAWAAAFGKKAAA